jgi:hypothetical protein
LLKLKKSFPEFKVKQENENNLVKDGKARGITLVDLKAILLEITPIEPDALDKLLE